jgi:Fe-S-cluster-containing dehydrogenase component
MFGYEFYVDQSRCIGCQSCVNACAECETHRGYPMIHVDFLDRPTSIATVPAICMHCDNPTCAQVCPADAIKRMRTAWFSRRSSHVALPAPIACWPVRSAFPE